MAVKRVLAVENNELVLSFLEAGLATAGYDVDTATNGREALEKIERGAYDVIISDIRMPELDGLELCRTLGERPGDFCPGPGERLGLGPRAVPHRDVATGFRQPLGHRVAHAADAYPPQTVCLHVRHIYHFLINERSDD